MKKVAIVCAAGKAARCLAEEAISRGYEVTGFVRGSAHGAVAGEKIVVKDLFELTREDLAGFDAVIDAFGAWTSDTLPQHKSSLLHLCDALSGTNVRLFVVGGAGSLYADTSHTAQVMQLPSFPDAFKPLAANMGEALAALRQRGDVKWTYLSPAADFQADGPRTGKYRLGGEEYFVNDAGESRISYRDYAAAMIDLLAREDVANKRLSVIGA